MAAITEVPPELIDTREGEGENDHSSSVTKKEVKFSEVRRKRKRKDVEMETDQGDGTPSGTKRPSFPPVDASTAMVRNGRLV